MACNLTFLVVRPVVRAAVTVAVVAAGAAVAPLGAARLLAGAVALGGFSVGEGELRAAPAVLPDAAHEQWVHLRAAAAVVHAAHAVAVVGRRPAIPVVRGGS